MTILILVIYLVIQLSFCVYISKKIKTESDYLVGGRQFSLFMISVSLFATWFGAETCIGSSGAVFEFGLSGSRADPFGYTICLLLVGFFIAPKIWNTEYLTLSDFYKKRYGAKTALLAVVILSFSSLIWGAAQLRAFGQVIGAISDIDTEFAITFALVLVVLYTLLGGLMGDIISDVIQAFVIIFGLCSLLYVVCFESNIDIPNLLSKIEPSRLTFLSDSETWIQRIERWSIPVFGSLVAQEVISRLLASRSKKIALRAPFYSAAIYLIIGLIPVFLGLIGPEIIQLEGENEGYLITLAKKFLSPVLMGLFSGAIISALLSTIDSILLSVGGLISHNFLVPTFKIQSPQNKLRMTRFVVILSAIVAFILALKSEGIYELLEVASAFGTSGILIITLFGLWTRRGSELTANMTLLVGLFSYPIFEFVLNIKTPFLMSLGFCLVIFIGVNIFFDQSQVRSKSISSFK